LKASNYRCISYRSLAALGKPHSHPLWRQIIELAGDRHCLERHHRCPVEDVSVGIVQQARQVFRRLLLVCIVKPYLRLLLGGILLRDVLRSGRWKIGGHLKADARRWLSILWQCDRVIDNQR